MVVELAVQHLVAGEAPRLRLAGARVALEHLVAQGLQHLFVDLLPLEVLFPMLMKHRVCYKVSLSLTEGDTRNLGPLFCRWIIELLVASVRLPGMAPPRSRPNTCRLGKRRHR